ncbi:hypothetical protein RsTz2092_05320 [Deferribacterales bacterium RsTz2092]|nr:hypothetical protein AGMMS49941_00990 [Deferribacterales bacterium]
MSSKTSRVGVIVALTLCLVAFISIISITPSRLVLTNADTGEEYAHWAYSDGMEFSVEFIHSVHRSPVRDTFQVRGCKLYPIATTFTSYGAGMQTELNEGEELRYNKDGTMTIIGFKNSFKRLNYIVGTVSDHILYIGGQNISLRDLCGRNAHISIFVR